ncbi:MAG TPA: tyrosine-type recombinase/integrase [Terracidiphilus sp.]|nr:tyrosine-type recombinase/integrase [Terracidiphilus sp.]
MPKAKERDGVFQRKDRSGWWVSYVDASGKRKKEKVTAFTRTQAMTALAQIKTRIERESILGVKSASEITTADMLKRFKAHQKAHLRPTTFVRLDGILETLKAALPALAKEITRRTVADYILERSETVSAGTVAKEFATLRHALQLAVEWELLTTNPAQGAKLPKMPQGRTRYLSPSELKTALEAAPDWMRLPLALAAFTGMRRGELLSLRWTDVDLENRRLYLRETKNGSLRVLPLNELAFRLLAGLPQSAPADLVLAGVDGAKLSVYTRRLFQSLGIQDASFHSLRHTAASWLVMQGVDLYAVGQLLGHRTPRMTQRYAHLSPQFMAGAVEKLDKVFGGVMPESAAGTSVLVPVESPLFETQLENASKLLN